MNANPNTLSKSSFLRWLKGTHVPAGTSRIANNVDAFLADEDFTTNILMVGPPGCGKTIALERAIEGLAKERPILYLTARGTLLTIAAQSAIPRETSQQTSREASSNLFVLTPIELSRSLDEDAAEILRKRTRLIYESRSLFENYDAKKQSPGLVHNVLVIMAMWAQQGKKPVLVIDEPLHLLGQEGCERLFSALRKHKIYASVKTITTLQSIVSMQDDALDLFDTALLFHSSYWKRGGEDMDVQQLGAQRATATMRKMVGFGQAVVVRLPQSSHKDSQTILQF